MPIQNKPSGRVRTLVRDLFTNHKDNKPNQIGEVLFVNPEPTGQETLDSGKLVPIFEAMIITGDHQGMIFNVAQEELNIPIEPDPECPCWIDEQGNVAMPMLTCNQHKNLTKVHGGE